MYNITDKMVRESTKDTGNNYYVNSANGLYYTVMREVDIQNATELLNQAVAKKNQFGKGSVTIYSTWADVLHPSWKSKMKTQYAFKRADEENWGSLINGSVFNNNSIGSTRSPTENKLNVKCAYVIHEMLAYYNTASSSNLNNAKDTWTEIVDSFDDNLGGYVDSIANYREAYKQGLVKICSSRFAELRDIGEYQEASGMWDNNLQNQTTGGIYMRYIRDSKGKIVNNGRTYENTESTAAIILGYR